MIYRTYRDLALKPHLRHLIPGVSWPAPVAPRAQDDASRRQSVTDAVRAHLDGMPMCVAARIHGVRPQSIHTRITRMRERGEL